MHPSQQRPGTASLAGSAPAPYSLTGAGEPEDRPHAVHDQRDQAPGPALAQDLRSRGGGAGDGWAAPRRAAARQQGQQGGTGGGSRAHLTHDPHQGQDRGCERAKQAELHGRGTAGPLCGEGGEGADGQHHLRVGCGWQGQGSVSACPSAGPGGGGHGGQHAMQPRCSAWPARSSPGARPLPHGPSPPRLASKSAPSCRRPCRSLGGTRSSAGSQRMRAMGAPAGQHGGWERWGARRRQAARGGAGGR